MQRAQLVLRVRGIERSFPPPPCDLLHPVFSLVLFVPVLRSASFLRSPSFYPRADYPRSPNLLRPIAPSFIPRLSPVHHTQSDASCEAETSFLSCFAFDDFELTCSTTTSRPCSFPFDSPRALASSFSLHSISFVSLFSIYPPIELHFFLLYYLDAFLISFGLICNFILKCILHHASIKLSFFSFTFFFPFALFDRFITSPSFLPRQIFKFFIEKNRLICTKTYMIANSLVAV